MININIDKVTRKGAMSRSISQYESMPDAQKFLIEELTHLTSIPTDIDYLRIEVSVGGGITNFRLFTIKHFDQTIAIMGLSKEIVIERYCEGLLDSL